MLGKDITLTCVVGSEDRIKKIEWEKTQECKWEPITKADPKKYLVMTNEKPSLTIYNLEEQDFCQYRCIVENCSDLKGNDIFYLQGKRHIHSSDKSFL